VRNLNNIYVSAHIQNRKMTENTEDLNDTFPTEKVEEKLVITEDIRSYIYESAKWTKFLSIVGFIFSAFTLLFAFGSSAFLSTLASVEPNNPLLQLGPGFIMALFTVFALLYFYPSLILFNYSSAAKNAVLYADQEGLNQAMSKLKSFFKFWGIIMIVFISFYILAIISSALIATGMK
jgi:hypothetical protein